MISRERLEKSLEYLASTDETCARLRADHARAEFKAKSIKNTFFRSYDGSVADRWARAETEQKYLDAREQEFTKFCKYEAMKNKRQTEMVVIDTWRSLNASRNKGQLV